MQNSDIPSEGTICYSQDKAVSLAEMKNDNAASNKHHNTRSQKHITKENNNYFNKKQEEDGVNNDITKQKDKCTDTIGVSDTSKTEKDDKKHNANTMLSEEKDIEEKNIDLNEEMKCNNAEISDNINSQQETREDVDSNSMEVKEKDAKDKRIERQESGPSEDINKNVESDNDFKIELNHKASNDEDNEKVIESKADKDNDPCTIENVQSLDIDKNTDQVENLVVDNQRVESKNVLGKRLNTIDTKSKRDKYRKSNSNGVTSNREIDSVINKLKANMNNKVENGDSSSVKNDLVATKFENSNVDKDAKSSCLKVVPKPIQTIVIDSDNEVDDHNNVSNNSNEIMMNLDDKETQEYLLSRIHPKLLEQYNYLQAVTNFNNMQQQLNQLAAIQEIFNGNNVAVKELLTKELESNIANNISSNEKAKLGRPRKSASNSRLKIVDNRAEELASIMALAATDSTSVAKKRKSLKLSKDLSSSFKQLPPDVEAMVEDVERQSVRDDALPISSIDLLNRLYPQHQNVKTGRNFDERSGKYVEIEDSVMQNLAACGTQISFGNGKTFGSAVVPQVPTSTSYKPDVSIFLKGTTNPGAEEMMPQDLSVSKKSQSNATSANTINRQPPKKPVIMAPPPKTTQPTNSVSQKAKVDNVSLPLEVKFSEILDSQLAAENTVKEVPSFVSPFVIEAPPAENLKKCLEQLKNAISESSNASDASEELDDGDVISTQRAIEQISKENPNDRHNEYFTSSLGKFFTEIGFNIVLEHVQKDIIDTTQNARSHDLKRVKILQSDLVSLAKSYEVTRKKNASFKSQIKKCDYCNYTSESDVVLRRHLETTPHVSKSGYSCMLCSHQMSGRNMSDFYQHMIAVHNITPTYEKQTNMECCNCEFSCKTKKSLEKHVIYCATQFKEETNCAPDVSWEPPVKISKLLSQPSLLKTNVHENNNNHAYQQYKNIENNGTTSGIHQRLGNVQYTDHTTTSKNSNRSNTSMPPPATNSSVLKTSSSSKSKSSAVGSASGSSNSKNQIPSVRTAYNNMLALQMTHLIGTLYEEKDPLKIAETMQKIQIMESLMRATPAASVQEAVVCEVCDSVLAGKSDLRTHLMSTHNVKIHPRMLNQKPNLNCEKCEQRFYTDQGLERHLLGKHGLVSKMLQNAACTGKDAGRCPLCGKYLSGGLLTHMTDVHQTLLRPAFLSYKCTVCTATFPAYSLFETHVYTQHKTVLPIQ